MPAAATIRVFANLDPACLRTGVPGSLLVPSAHAGVSKATERIRPWQSSPWLLAGLLATLPIALVVFFVSSVRQNAVAAFATTLLGVVWVGGGLAHLLLVRDIPDDGRLLIFTVLLTVFADDTAAYFVGRAIGRHRLAPAISPGKSVEGFVAGTLVGVAVTFFALYEQDVVSTGESILLGLAIALAATLGDLFESAIKRDLGVKDSGRLLAGHGGVLDRVDSLLWAGPAAYFTLLALL